MCSSFYLFKFLGGGAQVDYYKTGYGKMIGMHVSRRLRAICYGLLQVDRGDPGKARSQGRAEA